LTQGRITRRN